jgi:hypothetical protein
MMPAILDRLTGLQEQAAQVHASQLEAKRVVRLSVTALAIHETNVLPASGGGESHG